jgi:xanthine dehydrogenase accessory factor
MQNVLDFAAENVHIGEKVAFVTVTATDGSSPASPGQVMAVLADGSAMGTVCGGASEFRLIKQAVEVINNGISISEFAFDHAEEGMVCGGSMQGFINVIGSQANLAIFGGGHIAQCLAKIARLTGFSVTIIEDREDLAELFPKEVRYVVCDAEQYNEADVIKNCDYAVICSRGHSTDAQALRYCLQKPLKYLGMIGSSAKVAAVFEQMRKEGATQESLSAVYSPIGLNIASEIPAEIAVSILAEILMVKNGGTSEHKR